MTPVYVNGRFLTQRRSGMQRWSEEILNSLDELLDGADHPAIKVKVLVPNTEYRKPTWKNISIETCGKSTGHLWEQLDLYSVSKNGLLLNLMSSGPLLHHRQIVTMHDANVFRNPGLFSKGYAFFHRTIRPILGRKAIRLLTVSDFSASELSSILKISKNKFTILPNSADHFKSLLSDGDILQELKLTPGKFALCVGNHSPNKNLESAIKAFNKAELKDFKLVLVGTGQSEIFGESNIIDVPHIVKSGYISDSALKSLYEHAAFLCFPSRYEGFGVPVIEAMSLGCPVIASNTSAIPEVAGGAAILCDPDDIDSLSNAMRQLSVDRHYFAEKGRARAELFSWAGSAKSLLRVLLNETKK